ncbi:TIM barrel protein [Propionicimonas sp. T2.31MG-18]|uniref:TIM barrel protein n=1 Tax=Propionicimonas sp. T2.31MG-18 TaxID=3157620 RepID=UPI00366FB280
MQYCAKNAAGRQDSSLPRADPPFGQVCKYASEWGYDGLEIACWGDHLDVYRAAEDDAYVAEKKATLGRYGLGVWAISNHLKGQAVCDDPIDFRHCDMVSDTVWGDGDPEGVRQRAAEELKLTAVAARKLGSTPWWGSPGSKIWQYVAMFPPVPDSVIEAGYQDVADRLEPDPWTCSAARASASPTRCTPRRSPTTTG